MRAAHGITTASGTFLQRMAIPLLPSPPPSSSRVSDGLLESAYLDDPEKIPALVREAVARLLLRR